MLSSVFPGVLLLGFTVAFFTSFVNAMATDPQMMGQFLVAGLMIGFVWYLYMHLHHFLRRLLTRWFRHSSGNDHGGGHGH